jgi:Putative MetA-pathway of phenol degradation
MIPELLAQNAVLFAKVINDMQLPLVHPARHGQQNETERIEYFGHYVDLHLFVGFFTRSGYNRGEEAIMIEHWLRARGFVLAEGAGLNAQADPALAVDQNSPSAPEPINTDRPAFTDSSVVVPKQSLQIENGFLETETLGQQSFDVPETLLRFGVAGKTELRFTAPDYYQNLYSGTGFGSVWSDLLLGVKQQLGPVQGCDVSVIVSLSLPSGGHSVSSHGYDPEVQLPWSRKLSANGRPQECCPSIRQLRAPHETRRDKRPSCLIGN